MKMQVLDCLPGCLKRMVGKSTGFSGDAHIHSRLSQAKYRNSARLNIALAKITSGDHSG